MLKRINYLLGALLLISMVILPACSSKLSEIESDGIKHIYEVEKVARDVYQYFYDKWGTPVQDVISGSEQNHMDIMKEVIDKYKLSDPAAGNGYGEFSTAELQKLYDDLIALGATSETDAISTAAMIEEYDIVEIQKIMAETDRGDVIDALNRLMAGSEDHLRIFTAKLLEKAIVYQPQYLSQQEYADIIASGATQPPTTTTQGTSSGVTFGELALKGEQAYGANCINCHGQLLPSGAGYSALSKYQNAQTLLVKISTMPKKSADEYREVLAYLLAEHGWVSDDTPFNADTLFQISLQ